LAARKLRFNERGCKGLCARLEPGPAGSRVATLLEAFEATIVAKYGDAKPASP
jgi:hypothetical protein